MNSGARLKARLRLRMQRQPSRRGYKYVAGALSSHLFGTSIRQHPLRQRHSRMLMWKRRNLRPDVAFRTTACTPKTLIRRFLSLAWAFVLQVT